MPPGKASGNRGRFCGDWDNYQENLSQLLSTKKRSKVKSRLVIHLNITQTLLDYLKPT
jgi:hypothetical protein